MKWAVILTRASIKCTHRVNASTHAYVRTYVCGRAFPSNSLPKLDRQIETVAYPPLGKGVAGCLGERRGRRERRPRPRSVSLSPRYAALAHPSFRSLVSSERTRRHEGAAPRHPCYGATVCNRRSCAGRFNLEYVWSAENFCASSGEFKPTLLREMGFFNLRPVFLPCRLFFFRYTCFHPRLQDYPTSAKTF